ncbi:MAG TPA: AmiS/UreI family transporter [Candidatus Dormibacteraeota bacterium]|nr:AmiS/UreI family transporter [Candidatus Dormibacteraeota bacterium]
MIAVMLLYVGAVLVLNGVWILGSALAETAQRRVQAQATSGATGPGVAGASYLALGNREVGVMNLFVGVLGFLLAMFAVVRVGPTNIGAAEFEFGAFVLLFAFTYLYVGINQFLNADGRALGWYCLFVAITAVPTAIITLLTSRGHAWPVWLGADWAAWAVLWFLFWVLLALQRPIARLVGTVTVFVAVTTCWIPAYLLLTGYLPGS